MRNDTRKAPVTGHEPRPHRSLTSRHRLGLALLAALALAGSSLPASANRASAQTSVDGELPAGGAWVEICEVTRAPLTGDGDSRFDHDCYWVQI